MLIGYECLSRSVERILPREPPARLSLLCLTGVWWCKHVSFQATAHNQTHSTGRNTALIRNSPQRIHRFIFTSIKFIDFFCWTLPLGKVMLLLTHPRDFKNCMLIIFSYKVFTQLLLKNISSYHHSQTPKREKHPKCSPFDSCSILHLVHLKRALNMEIIYLRTYLSTSVWTECNVFWHCLNCN